MCRHTLRIDLDILDAVSACHRQTSVLMIFEVSNSLNRHSMCPILSLGLTANLSSTRNSFVLHGFYISPSFYITQRIDGFNRLVNGMNRLFNCIGRLIDGIASAH